MCQEGGRHVGDVHVTGGLMNEYEEYARKLRPSGLHRWLMTWDAESMLLAGGLVFVLASILVFLAAFMPPGEETKARATRLLMAHGYEDIKLDTVNVFACGKDDVMNRSVHFTALSSGGMRLEGAVCCGWVKDCTIRFE